MLQQEFVEDPGIDTNNALPSLPGFDPKFADYPDYLMQVNAAIWEARGLALASRDYLHQQMIRRNPFGIDFGPSGTAQEASEMLAMFPDLELRSEDVMWSGTPQRGYLGSQRLFCSGSHQRDGRFGTASSRRVGYRMMVDSYAKANRISDQWMIQDTGAILRLLGLDVMQWVEAMVPHIDTDYMPFLPEKDEPGPYTSSGESSEWGDLQKDIMKRLMSGDGSVIRSQYDRACQLVYPGGQTLGGWAEAESFWFGLRGAMPDAFFKIHHAIGNEDALMPARAAIRWSLTGRHSGWGPWGAPSGAELHVMGITHVELGPWGLRREWTLYDEAAIALQIALATRG